MTAARKAALRRGELIVVMMAEIESALGTGYFWSGVGDLDFGGQVYRGFGELVAVSQVVQSTEVEVVEVTFTLSGVDADLLADLPVSVKGRQALLYEAILDTDYRVVDRRLITEAEMDYRVYAVDASGKATIGFVCHAGFHELLNRSAAKWGPEEAKAQFPDETGFDRVHLVEDTQDVWRAA